MPINSIEFDRFLSESSEKPEWIIMNPSVWTGYWDIKPIPIPIRVIAKWLGKLIHNRAIMWVGLPLYWVDGLSSYFPDVEANFVEDEYAKK